MTVPERIETERLLLQAATREHVTAEYLHDELFARVDEDTLQHASWEPHDAVDETREFLARREELWADEEKTEHVVFATEGGELTPVGTGYMNFDWDGNSCELGFWLRRPYWGREYAGEWARKMFDVGFTEVGLDVIFAGCLLENRRSRRAQTKFFGSVGGAYDGVEKRVGGKVRHMFSVTCEEYDADATGLSCRIPGVDVEDVAWSSP